MVLFKLKKKIAAQKLARTKRLETARLAKLRKKAKEEMQLAKINAEIRRTELISKVGLTPAERRILQEKKKREIARRAKVKAGLQKTGKIIGSILDDIDKVAGSKPKRKRKTTKKTPKRKKRRSY